jgi:hypothetical protein
MGGWVKEEEKKQQENVVQEEVLLRRMLWQRNCPKDCSHMPSSSERRSNLAALAISRRGKIAMVSYFVISLLNCAGSFSLSVSFRKYNASPKTLPRV